MVLIKNCIRNLEIKDKIIQRHYTMLKNLLKHFSKKKEDEKKTQTFQPLYRKHDRIINQQLAKDILLGTAIGDALGFPVQFIPR